ncbi:MAG TPA: ferrous iron transport protein A [Desulfobacteraceae bacterium]|nr:ferrous iron transport protein A [Deltaproteobacteria bacterium]MBW2355907.1 ferrous iron transport protein A [Deltaproteobacteria bacterium]RLB97987.1 MAG: FeoA family protein [Deltaproteobacteria bacterium]HDI60655.1 ferrous iron transport protein A [Desulfobacteraceae bacterium]
MLTLKDMREGQEAVIARVGGNGALRRRLLEMGLRSGVRIRIEKYAPLRDPLELVINAMHVSLRVEEAAKIEVDPVGQ